LGGLFISGNVDYDRLGFANLPAPVVDQAKACVLHLLAVGSGRVESQAASVAQPIVEREEARASRAAWLMVHGTRVGRTAGAFANNVMGHAKLQEVAYLTASHPGEMVIRAALASADGPSISGTDFPTTLVAGYQTQCAITNRYSRLSKARALRSSPIDSMLGATMAAAKVMGLDEASLTLALGLAAAFASGTFESRGGGMISILQVA
jgi:2-methylcitrate dehydratase PrpD